MSSVLNKVKDKNEIYDQTLNRLSDSVKQLAKPYDYANGNHIVKISVQEMDELSKCIEKLNVVTDEVSSMISELEDMSFVLPGQMENELTDELSGLENLIDANSIVKFSFTQLKKLGSYIELPSIGICISALSGLKVLRLKKELNNLKVQLSMFNDWIHDVNHYMSRIQVVMPNKGGMLSVDELHSLDALIGALKILKNEFEEDLGIIVCQDISGLSKYKAFELYKLFHKYRYCFYRDGVKFVTPQKNFRRRLKPIPGMGTIALNLYHNAVKYLAEYHGQREIRTSFEETKDGVDITVTSMGPIVLPEEIVHIGEKGFRSAAARKSHRGNGKGLARVIRVCHRAGFNYSFKSEHTSDMDESFALFSATISIPSDKFEES